MNLTKEKPELVETDSGFSVFYKNKHLYSKRNPKKSILRLIENTSIPPKTLVLCISPILGYGIEELIKKAPENSLIVGVEFDESLMEFSIENIEKKLLLNKKFIYIKTNSISSFLEEIEEEIGKQQIRRALRIDFSGGSALYKEFYDQLTNMTSEFISRYWINRLTLIQFGRNYARNFFKNFSTIVKVNEEKANSKNDAELSPSFSFINLKAVKKPIMVLGAGPSLDSCISFLEQHQSKFFIIAVDAASGIYPRIKPDAIAILESQYWIQRAFIGLANSKIPIMMDMTSNPKIVHATGGKLAFFYTEYIKNDFFIKVNQRKLLPMKLEPMGSVGLSALCLAEKLAAPNIPIFHTGLDFSWGNGLSHTKASYQAKELMSSTSKFNNLYSSFKPESKTCEKIMGKNDLPVFTTPNLKSYAEIYKAVFAKKNNFFDIGNSGIDIGSNVINLKQAELLLEEFYNRNGQKECENFTAFFGSYEDKKNEIKDFIKKEKNSLLELRDFFTGEKEFDEYKVKKLLNETPYLYLHFPDYYSNEIKLEQSFLRRIRIEIEYFLKTMNL